MIYTLMLDEVPLESRREYRERLLQELAAPFEDETPVSRETPSDWGLEPQQIAQSEDADALLGHWAQMQAVDG